MFNHPIVARLIGVALQGEKKWEWAPILLARVSLGLFFAVSGWNKLFVEKNKAGLLEVMHEIGIPFPEFFAVVLASVEFFGGSLLTVGLLSAFCGIALAFAMVVAIATVEVQTIPTGLSFLNWLDYFLYLPQVLYVILFAWLLVSGPGPISIDHLLARKLGVAADRNQATPDRIETFRERTELQ